MKHLLTSSTRRRVRLLCWLLAGGGAVLTTTPALAISPTQPKLVAGPQKTTVYTFTGSGNYTDATRWSPAYPGTTIDASANLAINGNCTLNADVTVNGIYTQASSATLTIPSGRTLTLAGSDKLREFRGTVTVEAGGNLVLSGSGSVDNYASLNVQGTTRVGSNVALKAYPGGYPSLQPGSTFIIDNNGTLKNNGTSGFSTRGTIINNGVSDGMRISDGGLAQGTGTFNFFGYEGDATVSPGNDGPGILTSTNGFISDFGTVTLNLDVQNDAPGAGHDQLVVDGFQASYDGTINVNFGDYTPAVGTTFQLLAGSSPRNGAPTVNVTSTSNQVKGTLDIETGIFTVTETAVAQNLVVKDGEFIFQDGGTYVNVTVEKGGVLFNRNAPLVVTGALVVENGGGLAIGSNGPVEGEGSFTLASGATLFILDADGITAESKTGAVRTATRSFSPAADYYYGVEDVIFEAPRATGDGLPATVDRLTVDSPGTLVLTNSLSVRKELHLLNGRLVVDGETGVSLTLLSTAEGTALLDMSPFDASLQGRLTVQRYIDGSLTAESAYRHLGAPVQGTTVSSFGTGSFSPRVNPTYNTNPSSLTAANFPNVFFYDQSRIQPAGSATGTSFDQGWVSPESLDEELVSGTGYTVHMPGNQTLSFTGNPNVEGYFQNFGPRGSAASAGYHLVANPYAAPLNWDEVVRGGNLYNVETALRVYKSTGAYDGAYGTYLPATAETEFSIAVAGGTPIIPLGQAFLLRTTEGSEFSGMELSPGSGILSTSYEDTKDVKVQRGKVDPRTMLRLDLRNTAGTKAHETVVYFDAAATAATDKRYDATYLAGPGQQVSLTSESAGTVYSINGQPALTGQDVQVALRLRAATAGTYVLSTKSLANLPAGYHAYLLDATTGTRTDLSVAGNVNVTLAANTTLGGRYSVLFSKGSALASAPAALAALVSVYPNPAHGTATLRLPAALRAGQATSIEVVNSLGQTVRTTVYPAAAESLELRLDGLSAGVYTVQARTAGGPVSRRLVVE